MFKRAQFEVLVSRIAEPRSRIQVISGPRQVGKSTLIKQLFDEITIPCYHVTADDTESNETIWINQVWENARARMRADNTQDFLLIIDEVQKIKNWSEAVKKEWDQDTFNGVNIKVVLLGSSRVLLKDGLTESLAGRYELIRMPHWSYPEMKEAFDVSAEQYIYFGGYPGAVGFLKDERRWARYIKDSIVVPAIEKDVFQTKILYNPELMRRLFEFGCKYSGEEISLRKILGELQDSGNVTTLSGYLNTLDEARLLCGLRKYAFNDMRKYSSSPKMMVYNTALFSALSGTSFYKAFSTPGLWGRWVESAVGAHLLNQADEYDYKLYYWRERDDEVDFVIEYNRECIAIEVKSGKRTNNKGLGIFREKYHPIQSLVVGSGGVPVEEFLCWDIGNLLG